MALIDLMLEEQIMKMPRGFASLVPDISDYLNRYETLTTSYGGFNV
jgi:hypothetical protein